MVHTFIIHNTHIVFDVESGSFFVADPMTYDLISAYHPSDGTRPSISEISTIFPYSSEEIRSVCEEIDDLIRQDVLFSAPLSVSANLFYPDQPRVKALCLLLTNECNLRCDYCFANTGDYHTGNRGNMSFETGKRAIDLLIESSKNRRNLDIDFFGGEPLVNWEQVVAFTQYCESTGPEHGKNIRLTITTNALGLDDEKAAFIRQHMSNCVLSIDGRESVHNNMRRLPSGKGSYDQISRNIKSFIKKTEPERYFLRGTFTRRNLDFTNDVLHLHFLGAQNVSIEPVVGPPEADYTIRQEDCPRIFTEYERLAQEILIREKNGDSFEFFHFNLEMGEGPCSYKRLKGCGVGTEYIAVSPNGDVYPCHQLTGQRAFLMGNVYNHSFDSMLSNQIRCMFQQLLVPQKEACESCWVKYYCSGGCPANAYFDTGNLAGQYRIGCAMQKKRVECALWMKAMRHMERVKAGNSNL